MVRWKYNDLLEKTRTCASGKTKDGKRVCEASNSNGTDGIGWFGKREYELCRCDSSKALLDF
jgi:hypothetical protein